MLTLTLCTSGDCYTYSITTNPINQKEVNNLHSYPCHYDQVLIQASTYSGTMENATISQMNNQECEATTVGLNTDINNIVFYSEYAGVKMGTLTAMKATTWYATLGYRLGKWMPHYTCEDFERGENTTLQQQNFSTLELRYELMNNTALKVEFSRIRTDTGVGMFASAPSDDSTNRFGPGLSVIF